MSTSSDAPLCGRSLLRVSHTTRRGQTYLSLRDEEAPFLLVTNSTPLPLVVRRDGDGTSPADASGEVCGVSV